ncbi:hypothetical protein BI084_gp75 [Gordonia phage Terapin]|uniref:Uncharacterized protein n=5 Tax=Terapinvirus terapin TaxID=2734283 RepID=A0A345MBB4_9CAUD|nr:hypothetical protein BI084_gp75 [Gordonia phage Terapin]AVP43351.1 hypothetical protein PBI_DJOKOVIC_74 [Gordonia phage Djokovic]AXH67785.1 hypothetical protein SEA_BEYONCAGE_74 [Gordonia phage Beyoncage]QOC56219.1 hypothetical protein SEA_SIENNA_74 [Gordonia phage Sienna]QOC56644.1 DNA binding protein [Gordonia phage BiteSize]QYW00876.1 DNA binding protein [Gordonia phage Madi]
MSLVAIDHGECNNCGHKGELVGVTVFTMMGYRPDKGCAKCHRIVMKRRWVVEKEKA